MRPFALLRFSAPFNIECVPAVFLDEGLISPADAAAPLLRSSNSFINTFHSWATAMELSASLVRLPTFCF